MGDIGFATEAALAFMRLGTKQIGLINIGDLIRF